jgi:hypothetical protein
MDVLKAKNLTCHFWRYSPAHKMLGRDENISEHDAKPSGSINIEPQEIHVLHAPSTEKCASQTMADKHYAFSPTEVTLPHIVTSIKKGAVDIARLSPWLIEDDRVDLGSCFPRDLVGQFNILVTNTWNERYLCALFICSSYLNTFYLCKPYAFSPPGLLIRLSFHLLRTVPKERAQ